MNLPPEIPRTVNANTLARELYQLGKALNGKNLLKRTWQEIAVALEGSGHLQSVIRERLRTATSRDDLLRVVRLVRKQRQRKDAGTGSGNNKASRGMKVRSALHQEPPEDSCPICRSVACQWHLRRCNCGSRGIAHMSDLRYGEKCTGDDIRYSTWPLLVSLDYLLEGRHRGRALFGDPQASDESRSQPTGFATSSDREPRTSTGNVETRLASFVEGANRGDEDVRALVAEASFQQQALIEQLRVDAEHGVPTIVKVLCLFSPFWVRTSEAWHPSARDLQVIKRFGAAWQKSGAEGTADEWLRTILISLVPHLFAVHDIPRCLLESLVECATGDGAWDEGELSGLDRSHPQTIKNLCWCILLGQGGSLKRAAQRFGWKIAGRFEHFLRQAPSDIRCLQDACLFADIHRLGGTEVDYRRIQQNPAYRVDTTEEDNSSYRTFWEATVRWMIAHRDDVTDEQAETILAWAMHEYTEERRRGTPFSWKGRRVRSVLERAGEYHAAQRRPWKEYQWAGHGWNWTLIADRKKWTFVELTTGEELYEEGRVLHHCVAGYAQACVSGDTAIVSVRCDGKRLITVELHPVTKFLSQARGTYNRTPTSLEQDVIRQWQEQVLE